MWAEGMGQECSQTHGLRRTTVGGGVNACQGSSEFVQSLPAGAAGRQRDGAGANHHDLVDLPLTTMAAMAAVSAQIPEG